MSTELLFEPFKIGNKTTQSRVVMAPMTRSKSPENIPTEASAAYYRRRAENGVGLIITEGTVINHPAANGYPDVPHFYGEKALAGWRNVAEQVHAAGGLIFPQLWHVGSVRQCKQHQNEGVDNPAHCCHCKNTHIPGYGPSAVPHPYVEDSEIPQVMTQQDIDDVVQAFAQAALDAKNIGFDGIELHAAHGYLIDQFFWDFTNKRTDKYGGKTLAERTQFAVEIIQAVRKAVGPDFPICFRLSQWKMGDYDAKMAKTPDELAAFLKPLIDAGVDLFHCSTRRFFDPEFAGSNLNLAGWVKKLSGKPTITVGSVGLDNDFVSTFQGENSNTAKGTVDELVERLAAGEFDLTAVGRMLLVNPDWLQKIKAGEYDEVRPFSKKYLDELY